MGPLMQKIGNSLLTDNNNIHNESLRGTCDAKITIFYDKTTIFRAFRADFGHMPRSSLTYATEFTDLCHGIR